MSIPASYDDDCCVMHHRREKFKPNERFGLEPSGDDVFLYSLQRACLCRFLHRGGAKRRPYFVYSWDGQKLFLLNRRLDSCR